MSTENLDVTLDGSTQTTAPVVTFDPTAAASTISDLKQRQAGLSRTVDKYQRDIQERDAQIARLAEERETEAATLRSEAAEAKRIAAQVAADLENEKKVRADWERQYTVLQQKEATRAQVAQTHPGLLSVLDDLRGRESFADDTAYSAYLTRMQDTLFKSSPAYGVGSVPSASRPITTPNLGQLRSIEDIQADLWNPQLREKVPALEIELEQAMQQRRRN